METELGEDLRRRVTHWLLEGRSRVRSRDESKRKLGEVEGDLIIG